MIVEIIVSIAIGGLVGVGINMVVSKRKKSMILRKLKELKDLADREKEKAREEAQVSVDKFLKEVDEECEDTLKLLKHRENIYKQREENVKRKEGFLNKIKSFISRTESKIKGTEKEIDEKRNEQVNILLKSCKITQEDTAKEVVNNLEAEITEDYKNRLKGKYDAIVENVDQIGENIVSAVSQRYSKKNSIRVFFQPIPMKKELVKKLEKQLDELKGITEVELEYEEDEGVMYVNYYNLVRRTAAHEVLKAIVKIKNTSKINIKSLLKEASDKIHRNMEKLGQAVVKELGVNDLPKEIVKLIGRLNYRTSFGQNIMLHSLEVAHFATMLAYEVGADVDITKKAALLHDLGKAIDQDIEGSHDILTKQILEKYNIDPRIVHAAYNHHDAEEMGSVEARLVQASDAISASRPGARIEAGEQYVERIKALEETAVGTEGVIKAYAIQAGREIRSFVDPDAVSDEQMAEIAKGLAKKIEENVQYPGQVMVNMIRELKVTEHAK